MSVTTSTEDYRKAIQLFLDRELPSDWKGIGALSEDERQEFLPRWRSTLLEHGYLGAAWPKAYGGGGASVQQQSVLQEEFVKAGAPLLPLPSDLFAFSLFGPTLLERGTEEQKRHYIPRMLSAEDKWAQGYSEPGAGSDLFSLRTKAALVGDQWVINGQKIWQTAGEHANWIFALIRTEESVAGARGISMLMIPLSQEGVEVRPIVTMTGRAEFCEVFFTDARTDAANIVGGRGEGASVAMTLLGFERGTGSSALHASYEIEFRRLIELIRHHHADKDPVVRQRVARLHTRLEELRCLGSEALRAGVAGDPPGAESSFMKLIDSEYHVALTDLANDVLGMESAAWTGAPGVATLGPDPLGSPNTPAAWTHVRLTSRAATIYGGSSQIQRNTIGERVLGLPKEPRSVQGVTR